MELGLLGRRRAGAYGTKEVPGRALEEGGPWTDLPRGIMNLCLQAGQAGSFSGSVAYHYDLHHPVRKRTGSASGLRERHSTSHM